MDVEPVVVIVIESEFVFSMSVTAPVRKKDF